MTKVEDIIDGGINWFTEPFDLFCCGCLLCHKMEMGIGHKKGKPTIWYRMTRLDKATKKYRKSEKIYVDVERRIKRKK